MLEDRAEGQKVERCLVIIGALDGRTLQPLGADAPAYGAVVECVRGFEPPNVEPLLFQGAHTLADAGTDIECSRLIFARPKAAKASHLSSEVVRVVAEVFRVPVLLRWLVVVLADPFRCRPRVTVN